MTPGLLITWPFSPRYCVPSSPHSAPPAVAVAAIPRLRSSVNPNIAQAPTIQSACARVAHKAWDHLILARVFHYSAIVSTPRAR